MQRREKKQRKWGRKLIMNTGLSASRICWQCQGWGVVGYVNSYGNFVTDYNGNIVTTTCPVCNGNGTTH